MSESFIIENKKQWKEIIIYKLTPYEIEKATGVSHSVIYNSCKENTNPKSNTIEKIVKYAKSKGYTLEELGVREIESQKLPLYATRIKELRKDSTLTQEQLAKKVNVKDKSVVCNWERGNSEPTMGNYNKLAEIFGVSTLYLKGETKIAKPDNEVICTTLGINENTSNVLKEEKNIPQYGKNTKSFIKEKFGFDYTDINNFIIKDKELKNIFYLEACNVLRYYTSDIYKSEFEELFNELDVDLTAEELGIDKNLLFGTTQIPTPYKKTIGTIAKTVLQIKIGRMFDEFIDEMILNKNIKKFTSFELEMRERELLEQNKKINEELEKINKLKKKNNDK